MSERFSSATVSDTPRKPEQLIENAATQSRRIRPPVSMLEEIPVSFETSMGKYVPDGMVIDYDPNAVRDAMQMAGVPEECVGRVRDVLVADPIDSQIIGVAHGGTEGYTKYLHDSGSFRVVVRYNGEGQRNWRKCADTFGHEMFHAAERLKGKSSSADSKRYRLGMKAINLSRSAGFDMAVGGTFSFGVLGHASVFYGDKLLSPDVARAVAEACLMGGVALSAVSMAVLVGTWGYWNDKEERQARQVGKKFAKQQQTPVVYMRPTTEVAE